MMSNNGLEQTAVILVEELQRCLSAIRELVCSVEKKNAEYMELPFVSPDDRLSDRVGFLAGTILNESDCMESRANKLLDIVLWSRPKTKDEILALRTRLDDVRIKTDPGWNRLRIELQESLEQEEKAASTWIKSAWMTDKTNWDGVACGVGERLQDLIKTIVYLSEKYEDVIHASFRKLDEMLFVYEEIDEMCGFQ